MIEQIDEFFFNDFDNAEGENRIKEMDRLITQYAHKIREIIIAINTLSEKTEVRI